MAKKKANGGKNNAASLVPLQTGNQAQAAKQEVGVIKRAFDVLPETIRDDAVSEHYAHFMVGLTAARKSVEAKERSITKHLNAAKKIVTDLFKPFKDQLKTYRELCDDRLLEYQEHLEAKAEEERRKEAEREKKRLARLDANKKKALEAAETSEEKARVKAAYAGKVEQVQAETDARIEMIEDEPPSAPGVQFRTQLTIEEADLSLVPDEFITKSLNRTAVKDYALEHEKKYGKLPTISGLTIERISTTAVRG